GARVTLVDQAQEPGGSVRVLLFFFSSRRRHTRSKRDWSSDVCSSDLEAYRGFSSVTAWRAGRAAGNWRPRSWISRILGSLSRRRSEERRVGKECASKRGWESAGELLNNSRRSEVDVERSSVGGAAASR